MEDFNYLSFVEMFRDYLAKQELIDFGPSIIGISALFSPSYFNMMDLASVARDIFPRALIIAGGGIPTNMYEEIFKSNQAFDALCYGEGEKPLLGLIQADNKKEYLMTNQSWITRGKVNV
jgi:radical SAM superfamily enzyme YgiQ (UPF0313 family)